MTVICDTQWCAATERTVAMKKVIFTTLAVLLFLTGAGLLLYPHARQLLSEYENRQEISHFQEEKLQMTQESGQDGKTGADYGELLRQMQAYNASIYENGQSGLVDAWSYEQNPFDFQASGLPDDMVGYITIDAMDLEMPLYVGASRENMLKGAVVLGQTSMPIGGENTNCVIAAHRGNGGIPMFREIEVLQEGDRVEITNLWETIEYQVEKCIVIEPDNVDAVKILPGEDMVTLITCHPYPQNYQRYVVYCKRADGEQADADEALQERVGDGIPYESSEEDIRMEQLFNVIALGGLLVVFLVAVICLFVRQRKQRRKGRDR